MLKRLIISDLKRIRQLIIPFAAILSILLSVMLLLITNSDKLIYKDSSAPISIGILMKADSAYSKSAYNLISNMDSYKNTCDFINVDTKNEGIALLDDGDINALIIVPDNIISSIMDGTNTPVEVIYPQDGTLQTYVLNELFVSTASFLGTSQAAIYSVLSLCHELDISEAEYNQASAEINSLFLNHVLSRTDLFQTKELYVTGNYTIMEHYTASLIVLLLFLCSIMFMSFFRSYNQSVINLLRTNGINKFHIAFSRFISVWSVMYIFYIVIYIALGMISEINGLFTVQLNYRGFTAGLLLCAIITITAILISRIPVSLSGCSLLLLAVILIISYTGGLLVPELLLPGIFRKICPYTPGNAVLRLMCRCIY